MRSTALSLVVSLGLILPASAAQISLVLEGSSFDGPPIVEVAMGDEVLGRVAVTGSKPQRFSFSSSSADAPVSVKLVNDKYGDSKRDRNAFLLGASVNGVSIPVTQFERLRDGQETGRGIHDGKMPLTSEGLQAVVKPPATGWAKGDAASGCQASQTWVSGFANGVIEPAKASLGDLVKIVSGLGADCTVSVVGYSSLQGAAETNLHISKLRADAVAAALGLGPEVSIEGMGESDAFGDADANRVVVVSIQ